MAEGAAAQWLKKKGFKILAQNWRNRFCEIDIVAQKGGSVHFVEVKYRRSDLYGGGFDYITPDKIERLKRATSVWMVDNGGDSAFQIDVISVTGPPEAPSIKYLPNAIQD